MHAGPTLYDLDRAGFANALAGEPRYRVDQLWSGLYEQFLELGSITTLPATLRTALAAELPCALTPVIESVSDDGDTIKFLWRLDTARSAARRVEPAQSEPAQDEPAQSEPAQIEPAQIETVLMLYPKRATVCVSSQAGCAMACGFCATGQAGFVRHLSVGEIVEQVVVAARRARAVGRRLSNVVFMGMGEPLANLDAVWAAVERIHGDIGISARHLTISTVGLVPGIRRLTELPLPVNLAVSLHAANDTDRTALVPINRRYSIDDLVAACTDYLGVTGRRVSFEWAMIAGVNDRDSDAHELADLCHRLRPSAHVNLIPLNPTPGYPTTGSSPHRVSQFAAMLERRRVNVTIRANRGTEIDAACGQLAAGQRIEVVQLSPSRRRPSGRPSAGDQPDDVGPVR